jgi:hypothetical protein
MAYLLTEVREQRPPAYGVLHAIGVAGTEPA